ncbi:MAG TPA: hypothetical protein VHO23_00305, partial [Candidatus Paceibacterota bacterium]|nr:hypothetical protein [Candidatus Paceibacterota bacterium]
MARSGKIAGTQVGRTWLVSKESVELFMREQEERKRELAESLARTREEEYRKSNPVTKAETTPEARSKTATEERPAEATAPVRLTLRKPIVSPYAPKRSSQVARQTFALVATLGIAGLSMAVASSGSIARVAGASMLAAERAHDALATAFVAAEPASAPTRAVAGSESVRLEAVAFSTVDLAELGASLASAATHAAPFTGPRFAYVHSTGDERMLAAEAVELARDPKGAVAAAYATLRDEPQSLAHAARDAYQGAIARMGARALTQASTLRDAVAYAPYDLARMELAFGTAWMDASRALPVIAVESVRALGDEVIVTLARGIATAPETYDATVYAWVGGSHAVADSVARASQDAGTDVRTLARALESEALGVAGALALATERTEALPAATALAALPEPESPDWLSVMGRGLARATYGVFDGFFDWAGSAIATIIDPFSERFPVVTVLEPGVGTGTTVYGDTYTYIGTTTSVTNVTAYAPDGAVSEEYVRKQVEALRRSIDNRFDNRRDDSGSSSGGSFENGAIDGATITNSTFTGGMFDTGTSSVTGLLTVNGDATITGTLNVANLNYGSFSLSGPIAAPYFTATSSSATSTFAGGIAGTRIEAAQYLAGPYVLATSTTATSVFSGNIAVGRNATFGTSGADTLAVNSSIASSLIPSTTSAYDLGSSTRTWRNAFIDAITATSVSAVNATTTNLGTTNFTLGSDTFDSLLGTGLVNSGGALSVATSTLGLDTAFFKQGGNLFGTSTLLGTLDNNPLQFITNGLSRVIVDATGRVGIATSSPGSLFSVGGIANFTTGTTTFYGAGGINLASGCFSINGTCIGNGVGGAVSSVFGRTGAVIAANGDYTTDQVTEGMNLYYADARVQSYLDTLDKGYFFSTSSASYFLAQAGLDGYSTTSANYWLSTKSTSDLAEGTNLYYTDARVNGFIAASTTIAKTYANNAFAGMQTFSDFLATNGTTTNATSTNLYASAFRGAGLTACADADDKLLYDAALGQFVCSSDAGAGGGLTSLNGLSASTQTFATTSDTNIGLTITSSGSVHTFAPSWIGTLASGRGGTGISSVTANQLLIGNGSGTGWTQTATSSLGLLGQDIVSALAANFLPKWNGSAFADSMVYDSGTQVGIGTDTNLSGALTAAGTFSVQAEGDIFRQYDSGDAAWYPLLARYNTANGTFPASTFLFGNGTNSTVGIEDPGGDNVGLFRVRADDANFNGTATFGGLTTFSSGITINAETLTDLTGTGLTNSGGALTLDATGNWTGTFDGQEGTYYLANSFSTTSANYWKGQNDFFSTTSATYFLSQNGGTAYSTTSANYWLSTKSTSDLAEGTNLYYTDARVASYIN